MSGAVPATIRAAIRRLQRTPLGKHLELEDEEPLGDVLPIAWALGTVGAGAAGAQPRIAVVVDEDTDGNGLRWYGLIPSLLGAGKSCRVTQVIARYRRDRERHTPAALYAVKAPSFALGNVFNLANEAAPPSAIVFANADRGSGFLLRELTDPRVSRWLTGGTEIILLGDSDISLLFMMQAIADLDGETGLLFPREPRYLGGGGSRVGGTVAFRLLRAPRALPGCGAVVARMSAHLDVILATMTAGEVAAENDAMNFGISAPGRSIDTPGGSFMMLPFRFLYADLKVARNDVGPQTSVVNLDDLASSIAVPPDRMPPVTLLERQDVDAWLERYRLALLMYRDLVSSTLETVFGVYAVDDQGELEVREGGHEHADLLNEATWPHAADGASDADRSVPFAQPLLSLDVEPIPAGEQWIDLSKFTEYEGRGSDALDTPQLRPLESSLSVELQNLDTNDATRAALVDTIRELQRKLRVALTERDDARGAFAALAQPERRMPTAASVVPPASVEPANPKLPATWDELFIWAHRTYSNAVAFTSRARRAARKSVFRDVAQAAKAIELLAEEYRNVRVLGDLAARQAYDARLRDSGFSVGPTGLAVTSHQTSELYTATWEGKRYRLDIHLQGSSARDKARGLRVYFAWLPERAMILVGHLPTHLRNTLD
jgi:hypothetical protein